MAKNKTNETKKSVNEFISQVADQTMRDDSLLIIELMQNQTGFEAKMWGPSIVGFGSYHYVYESGHEGDMPLVCFSPRKAAIVLYLSMEPEKKTELLSQLGKYKPSKGCIYIKKLEDIDMSVLKKMVMASVKYNKSKYPPASKKK